MAGTQISPPNRLRDAYRRVNEQIAAAAERRGRHRDDVVLVAVTKNASPDQIRAMVEMGQIDFGENRVQHLAQRVGQLEEFLSRKRTLGHAAPRAAVESPHNVRWHMIGHLQRNKVKSVVPLVQLIHSVDSLRLAEELHAYGARHEITIDILLQVNNSGEAGKFGVAAPAAIHLAEQIDTMMYLRLRGLMTMAPYSDNPENARPTFARTHEMFMEMRDAKIGGNDFTLLSMGMSGDFEVAIDEGANLVRIGSALFGDNEDGQ